VLQRTVKNDLEDAPIVQYVTMLMNGLLSEMELDERAREQSSRLSVRNCVRLSVFVCVCVCVSVSLTVSLLSLCMSEYEVREKEMEEE
jgi:hypothetical protein